MERPVVAIVGRPNVGKSTLFNRLIGWRKAIVDPTAGLTRDRLYGVADWVGREFTVVDTAGLDLDGEEGSRAAIEAQTRVAIAEAQVIVFVLSVRDGLLPVDHDIAGLLRRAGQPVIVAANKADQPGQQHFLHEIMALGFPAPLLISAQHGVGIDDLLDRVLELLPEPVQGEEGQEEIARLAIMGRPNVGKSSLLNALLGDERAVVSELPGTTRDPVDTELIFDGLPVVLVDTAGIRRRAAARDKLERYGLIRGLKAMGRADAVLVVIDASTGIVTQDQHVAGFALEAGRGVVFVVNKIDLLEPPRRSVSFWRDAVAASFRFVPHAPVLTLSAKRGTNVDQVLPTALEVVGQRRVRMATNELNRILRAAFDERPPPSFRGKRLSLNFATQAAADTPTVVLFVNDVRLLHFSYRRYLENRIRQRFGYQGNPIRIVLRPAERDRGRRGPRR